MKLIDEKLGGTTPLEVILKFPIKTIEVKKDDDFDDWGEDENADNNKYWFTKDKIDKIHKVHNYLDSLDSVGKVLSFSSILQVAKQLNNNNIMNLICYEPKFRVLSQLKTLKEENVEPTSAQHNYIRIKFI